MIKSVFGNQIVLEEDYDENYEPTKQELHEYCKAVLEIDPETEPELVYIGREALKAPLPTEWRPCKDKDSGEIYYFNFKTGASQWDDPRDEYYREMVTTERKRRTTSSSKSAIPKARTSTTKKNKKAAEKTLAPVIGAATAKINAQQSLEKKPADGESVAVGAGSRFLKKKAGQKSKSNLARMGLSPNVSEDDSDSAAASRKRPQLKIQFKDTNELHYVSSDDSNGGSAAVAVKPAGRPDAGQRKSSTESADSFPGDDIDFGINKKLSEKIMDIDMLEPAVLALDRDYESSDGRATDRSLSRPVQRSPDDPAGGGPAGGARFLKSNRPGGTTRLVNVVQTSSSVDGGSVDLDLAASGRLEPLRLLSEVPQPAAAVTIDLASKEKQLVTANEKSLEDLKSRLEKELESKKLELFEENDTQLKKLKMELDKELEEQLRLVQSKHDEKLDAIRKKTIEETKQEEELLKSGQEQQLERVRQSLAAELEAEETSLRTEHEKTLAKLRAELETVSGDERDKLESVRLEVRQRFETQLADFEQEEKARFQAELEEKRDSLKTEHDAEMAELAERLGAEHKDALQKKRDSIVNEFDREIAALESSIRSEQLAKKSQLESEIEQLRTGHSQQLDELRSSNEAELNELRSAAKRKLAEEEQRLDEDHRRAVKQLRDELADEQRLERDRLMKRFDDERDALNEDQRLELQQLRDHHQTVLNEEKQKHMEAVKSMEVAAKEVAPVDMAERVQKSVLDASNQTDEPPTRDDSSMQEALETAQRRNRDLGEQIAVLTAQLMDNQRRTKQLADERDSMTEVVERQKDRLRQLEDSLRPKATSSLQDELAGIGRQANATLMDSSTMTDEMADGRNDASPYQNGPLTSTPIRSDPVAISEHMTAPLEEHFSGIKQQQQQQQPAQQQPVLPPPVIPAAPKQQNGYTHVPPAYAGLVDNLTPSDSSTTDEDAAIRGLIEYYRRKGQIRAVTSTPKMTLKSGDGGSRGVSALLRHEAKVEHMMARIRADVERKTAGDGFAVSHDLEFEKTRRPRGKHSDHFVRPLASLSSSSTSVVSADRLSDDSALERSQTAGDRRNQHRPAATDDDPMADLVLGSARPSRVSKSLYQDDLETASFSTRRHRAGSYDRLDKHEPTVLRSSRSSSHLARKSHRRDNSRGQHTHRAATTSKPVDRPQQEQQQELLRQNQHPSASSDEKSPFNTDTLDRLSNQVERLLGAIDEQQKRREKRASTDSSNFINSNERFLRAKQTGSPVALQDKWAHYVSIEKAHNLGGVGADGLASTPSRRYLTDGASFHDDLSRAKTELVRGHRQWLSQFHSSHERLLNSALDVGIYSSRADAAAVGPASSAGETTTVEPQQAAIDLPSPPMDELNAKLVSLKAKLQSYDQLDGSDATFTLRRREADRSAVVETPQFVLSKAGDLEVVTVALNR